MRSPLLFRQGLRIRPSYLVLLTALPFASYLFAAAESYQRALSFIAPGFGITLLVAVLGYSVACIPGLALAGLLLLKLGRRTLLLFGLVALVLALFSVFFFTRPPVDYSLIGEPRGRVAVIRGTPTRLSEVIRAGAFVQEGEPTPLAVRAVDSPEAARSLGLSGWQTARFVVPPQALRIVMPPLGNEFIAMPKDTSLLSVLAIRDIAQRTREFSAATFGVFPSVNTVAIPYIGLTLAASSFLKWLERRAKRGL